MKTQIYPFDAFTVYCKKKKKTKTQEHEDKGNTYSALKYVQTGLKLKLLMSQLTQKQNSSFAQRCNPCTNLDLLRLDFQGKVSSAFLNLQHS